MPEVQEKMDKALGPGFRKIIIIIAALAASYIVFALAFSFWPFSVARGIADKVVNADAIIQNYEWFYDQYNAIQAQKANVEIMPEGAVEKTGMQMVLNNAIAEYNSRSRQITRNLWKPNDLPYQIEIGE